MNAEHSHGDHTHSHGGEVHSHGDHTHSHEGEVHSHGDHTHGMPARAHRQAALGPAKGERVLYVDCFAGASGDMLLGALVDVGLPLEELEVALSKLDLSGYALVADRVLSHGLTGTQFRVEDASRPGVAVEEQDAFPARHLQDIRRIVDGSTLSEAVKHKSMAVVERLGRAEAGIHGVPLDEVHFHEIGAVDTIVDVVGFVAGLEILGVEQVYASAVPLGNGTIQTAHGRLPAPAPATLSILASAGAPTVPHPAQTEIVTPTGAALLGELATFQRPAMNVQRVGYGFGQKEFPWANGLRVWLGEREAGDGHGRSGAEMHRSEVVEFECNLDDSTGETLGYTMERLLEAGALDVWFTPIQMKKNRPGVLLSVLSPSDPDKVAALVGIVMRETSTLGVRTFPPAHRYKADRRMREVKTPWGVVRVKEKWLGSQPPRRQTKRLVAISPEYEDCARLARESGEPIVQIMNEAREIARRELARGEHAGGAGCGA